MNAGDYMKWYYLIYLLPGGTALLVLLLSALSGGRHHRSGGGHHSGGGHRHGGRPLPAHRHAGPKHAGPKHAAPSRPSVAEQALAFFGAGRVPGPFLWGSVLMGWGLFGFWATRFFEPALHVPALFVLPTMGCAVVGALGTAKFAAETGARLLPREESFAMETVELCGLTGTVAFPVDAMRGRVHVYDTHGTLHDVSARVTPGYPPILRGRRVLVSDFDAAHGFVVVEEIG